MFFIFGWNHRTTQNHGAAYSNTCPHCKNEVDWQLIQITHWFTFFFIPIFPTDNDYFLTCPICSHGKQVFKEQIIELKKMIELTNSFREGKITEENWRKSVDQIESLKESQILDEDVRKFKDVMSHKSTDELKKIITFDRDDYLPAAIRAAEEELERREINGTI